MTASCFQLADCIRSTFLVFLSTFRYTASNVPCESNLSAELIDKLF